VAEEGDVAKYARLMLQQAGVGDRLPTPVDDIVQAADLMVSKEITLHEIHHGFIAKTLKILQAALRKARGLVDLKSNIVYLDMSAPTERQAFVKLHEVGHKMLPWQAKALQYVDNDVTLSQDVRATFEQEANLFASEVLFQGNRFDQLSRDLPLEMKSAFFLAAQFGGSRHATLRRYAERHHKSCAVIVAAPHVTLGERSYFKIRQIHESLPFQQRFRSWSRPDKIFSSDHFAQSLFGSKNGFLPTTETMIISSENRQVSCTVEFFKTRFGFFLFIHPMDEQVKTKKQIILLDRNTA
jgi:Zn-dependent peptidase ImmA (M78 family)